MGLTTLTSRLAALLILHVAGAGLASTATVTRPRREYLPNDNQTMYKLARGEVRSLELNTSSISQKLVYITISPCSRDVHWELHHGMATGGQLNLLKENTGSEMSVFSVPVSVFTRYILKLSTEQGGGVVVSVRGEDRATSRLRLRTRSRRRLAANWESSPIDPQSTTYCVVASHRKNYTSLCAAQYDSKTQCRFNVASKYNVESISKFDNASESVEDNKIPLDTAFSFYQEDFKTYRRKKFGRSTKVSDSDPVIACVGDRTHHIIENLNPTLTYYVSVFGLARDRQVGSLLATGTVKHKTATAKKLKENVSYKTDVRGRAVYYFKSTVGNEGGLWVTMSTCGGPVNVEVIVRGTRVYVARNIEPYTKFFVAAPQSSALETSDEGSIQFDSSSEEMKVRYIIRVTSSRGAGSSVGVELTASTSRWGVPAPELSERAVRELRPRRACRSLDVAFLPATLPNDDVIRYCINVRENISGESYECSSNKKSSSSTKIQCTNHIQRPPARVITQKIHGLKPGRKYVIQVTASVKGISVPYNVLYADTNPSCQDEQQNYDGIKLG